MKRLTESQRVALRDALAVPEDIANLADSAATDLYYGPSHTTYEGCDVGGFEAATRAITVWCAQAVPSRMWLDTEADIWLDSEPESWTDDETGEVFEPMWADYIEYYRKSLVCELFGRELAEYL